MVNFFVFLVNNLFTSKQFVYLCTVKYLTMLNQNSSHMKTEKKLTVDQFSLYCNLKKRRDELLYFANYDKSDRITLSYFGWALGRTISCTLYEFSVINAAKKEARRLSLQIQDEMDSLMQSDEKETKEETSQQDVPGSLPGLLRKLFRRLTSRTSK